jgi:hypothetical protein
MTSLWAIDIEQLTIEQLDEFLQAKQPEGSKLDYKATAPKELQETICAFANTHGGMIVIGVDEDKTTNTPIWPPTDPAPLQSVEPGLDMRVFQKASDAIYPPVSVRISKTLPNPHAPGKVLLVVRVDPSAHAPHAIDNGKRVVVCERKGNMKIVHDETAHIDRIQVLFERRRRIEDQREAMISEELQRAMRQIKFRYANLPISWLSIIPYFPDKPIVDREQCKKVLDQYNPFTLRTVKAGGFPGGSFGRGYTRMNGYPEDASVRLSEYGHLFLAEVCREVVQEFQFVLYDPDTNKASSVLDQYSKALEGEKFSMQHLDIHMIVAQWLRAALLYRKLMGDPLEKPTFVQVTFGFEMAIGLHITSQGFYFSKWPYIDPTFRATMTCQLRELIENPAETFTPLAHDVLHGFATDTAGYRGESLKEEWVKKLRHEAEREMERNVAAERRALGNGD